MGLQTSKIKGYYSCHFLKSVNGVTVLNNILLLITQSHLSITQASSSFKCLDTRLFMYATPTFITKALCLVTRVQLLLMTVKSELTLYTVQANS